MTSGPGVGHAGATAEPERYRMAKTEYSIAEIVTGGAVLAIAIGFFVFATQGAGGFAGASGYELRASFRSAEGITVGAPVRMAGVQIGTVTAMDLDTSSFRAETTFTVRDGIELPDDTAVAVTSEGLLGGSFLDVIPGESAFALEPGDAVYDTQSSVSLLTLLMRFFASDGAQ
jgi:phospholipid/cholesterol/gamma-HCH transport system substrate-binding protein